MSVWGIAKKGFGKALKPKLKTITGVKPAIKVPGASAKDIEKSRQAGHTRVWSQRKKIADDLEKKVAAGKEAAKKQEHLVKTKVLHKSKLFGIRADPSIGAKGTEPWSAPAKKIKKKSKTKHYYAPKDF